MGESDGLLDGREVVDVVHNLSELWHAEFDAFCGVYLGILGQWDTPQSTFFVSPPSEGSFPADNNSHVLLVVYLDASSSWLEYSDVAFICELANAN
jgi:hypothetical protein